MVFPKKKKYNLQCEWAACEDVVEDMDEFYGHLEDHFWTDVAAVPIQPGTTLMCQWQECNFVTTDGHQLVRHIFFHGFHTKLKWLGYLNHQAMNSHECQSNQNPNIIPDLPESGFQCRWDDCSVVVDIPDQFYSHVAEHALITEHTKLPEEKMIFKCLWEGCSYKYTLSGNRPSLGRYKLRDHMRTHTQERFFACPWCGNLFVNKTKLLEHFTRQMNAESHSFQCTHCSRTFASERILKDHMRHHVNHYQCPKCAMTCPNPSGLKHHMRYKHSTERPYACEFCEYRCKSSHDLQTHMQFHQRDLAYHCQVENCDYVVRSVQNLRYHYRVKHGSDDGKYYVCHLCDQRYGTGHHLTYHLRKTHDFQWPPGHCRFRYKENEDGMFRLQTFRYESALTKQLAFIEPAATEDSEAAGPSRCKTQMIVKKPKRRVTRPKFEMTRRKGDAASTSAVASSSRAGSSRRNVQKQKAKEITSKASKVSNKRKTKTPKKRSGKKAPKESNKKTVPDKDPESVPDLYINSECLEAADTLCNMKSNSTKKQSSSSKRDSPDIPPRAIDSSESLLAEIFDGPGLDQSGGQNPQMVTTRSGSCRKSRAKTRLNFTNARKRLRLTEAAGEMSPPRPTKTARKNLQDSPLKNTLLECSVNLVPLERPVFPNHHQMYCNAVPTVTEPSQMTTTVSKTPMKATGIYDDEANSDVGSEMRHLSKENKNPQALENEPENMVVQLDRPLDGLFNVSQPLEQADKESAPSPSISSKSTSPDAVPVRPCSMEGVQPQTETHVATLKGDGVEADEYTGSQVGQAVETLGFVADPQRYTPHGNIDTNKESSELVASPEPMEESVTAEVDCGQIIRDEAGNKRVVDVGGNKFYLVSGTQGSSGSTVYCLVKCSEFGDSEPE